MEVALGAFEEKNKHLGDNIDDELLSRPAKTALEYLRQVQREAALCPDVVVAQEYTRKNDKTAPNPHYQIKSGLTPAPNEYIPNLEWQYEQASRFAELRQGLNYFKTSSHISSHLEQQVELPNVACEDHWCRFCLGDKSLQEIKKRRRAQANTDSVKVQNEKTGQTDIGKETKNYEGNEPLLNIVTRIRHYAVIDILEYNLNWLQKLGFSERQGRWLYALMACLEKPLLPSVSSLLRSLARRCADLRASLPDKDDERLAPLNLIITIVTRYFDQTDLADET